MRANRAPLAPHISRSTNLFAIVAEMADRTDTKLLAAFETCTLPRSEWTHRAHVRVAFLYLRQLPFDEALKRTRERIQAFNRFHQVAEGPTEGYNETTTSAFLTLIDATMRAYGNVLPTPDSEAFCQTHPQLLSPQVLRLFYSPAQRLHPDAKTRFVEPDLAPLPVAPGAKPGS